VVTSYNDDWFAFGRQLSHPEFEILGAESRKDLIRKINDKSLSWEERDEAKNRVLAASLHEFFWRHCERGCFPYLGGPPWLDEGVATYRHRWHVDEIAVRFGVGHGKRELGFQANFGR